MKIQKLLCLLVFGQIIYGCALQPSTQPGPLAEILSFQATDVTDQAMKFQVNMQLINSQPRRLVINKVRFVVNLNDSQIIALAVATHGIIDPKGKVEMKFPFQIANSDFAKFGVDIKKDESFELVFEGEIYTNKFNTLPFFQRKKMSLPIFPLSSDAFMQNDIANAPIHRAALGP